jgi:type I restriction enzyme M protein
VAADPLRANSRPTAAQYAMPVLGLIFPRHADNRFKAFLHRHFGRFAWAR